MKLGELYKQIIEIAIKHDPRPKAEIGNALLRNKKSYRSLKGRKKAIFDTDSLFNPYSDTRILYGDKQKDIKTIMVGVDIEGAELLIADRFNHMGRAVDLVLSHHPGGRALTEIYKVMDLQTDRLKHLGISDEVAEDLMGERISEVERKIHAKNCMRSIDIARILDIPYMCAHTVADNMVTTFLQRFLDKKKPKTVGAALNLLGNMYEYREGLKIGIGPKILIGEKKRPAGKIFVDMTGGTEGSKRIFGRLSQIGIGTLVCMHLSESHFKEAKKEYINIIIAGHIPSDNIGLNLLFDELLKKEDFSIIPCSGFTRHSRR